MAEDTLPTNNKPVSVEEALIKSGQTFTLPLTFTHKVTHSGGALTEPVVTKTITDYEIVIDPRKPAGEMIKSANVITDGKKVDVKGEITPQETAAIENDFHQTFQNLKVGQKAENNPEAQKGWEALTRDLAKALTVPNAENPINSQPIPNFSSKGGSISR